MHHVALDRWSRGASPLHRRDPRAKTLALLAFLIVLATASRHIPLLAAGSFLLLCAAAVVARLPLGAVLLRSAVVLSFTAVFAALSWLAGDPARAAALLLKSYLSAFAVLLLVATTPLSLLLHGLERLGVPRFLLTVAQFLYRYLFVISEEAQHMRAAALCRGSSRGGMDRRGRMRAAGGAVAALFARSYSRAGDIHRAMLARGFAGDFHTLDPLHPGPADVLFAAAAVLAPVLLRWAVARAV